MSRYRKVHCLIWNDDKFPFLSDDAQLVIFHILTTPFSSPLGLFKVSIEALASEKRWSLKKYRKGFLEALENGFLKYNEKFQVIYIKNFLKYNPPDNPNVVRGWGKLFEEVPNCPEKIEYYQELDIFCNKIGEAYIKGFREGFGEGLPK